VLSAARGTSENPASVSQDPKGVQATTEPSHSKGTTAAVSVTEHSVAATSKASSVVQASSKDNFVKPLRRAGKLVPVDGSVACATVNLDQRITYWGRDPNGTCVYPQRHDTRVPKAAIDLVFWRADIEKDIRQGMDWTKMPDVVALIHTRASKCIKINGVELKMHRAGGWTFGRLRHGDIITVFEGANGCLKFRCEFYLGLSKMPRSPGEPFVVEEVKKEVAKEFIDSRSSMASSGDSMI
jgi:hypothetical protein